MYLNTRENVVVKIGKKKVSQYSYGCMTLNSLNTFVAYLYQSIFCGTKQKFLKGGPTIGR